MKYPIKYQIIQKLADGEFHSGEALGQDFAMSRAAISKHMKGIADWGVEFDSVKGKGYQLERPLNLLDETKIREAVSTPVDFIPVIDSTNQYLLNQLDTLEQGQVCVAEYQEKGRGRRGRHWVSPFGTNLYFSMYWKLESGMAAAMGLSLVIGVAVVNALESLGAKDIKLKWPNDIYYQDKKLAGILIELSGQAGAAADLVIGMGLNIQMTQAQQQSIDQPWSSLAQVFDGEIPDRNQLVIAFIQAWQQILQDYEAHGMQAYVSRWNQLDNFKDKPIKLIMGNKEVVGTERGINEQGAVLLETEQGVEPYIGGEISLRKA
ncbi:MAG: bifunctional biotin--[acetyl-CoA-carboxylase] ligase/biotin operon repressor BirA [Vibrio sp.]